MIANVRRDCKLGDVATVIRHVPAGLDKKELCNCCSNYDNMVPMSNLVYINIESGISGVTI